MSSLEMPRQWQ